MVKLIASPTTNRKTFGTMTHPTCNVRILYYDIEESRKNEYKNLLWRSSGFKKCFELNSTRILKPEHSMSSFLT